jgi:hypothetical protein
MKSQLKPFEFFDTDPEEYLRYCWIAITVHIDKPRALWYAVKGKEYLDELEVTGNSAEEIMDALYKNGMGYQIAATAFVWNEWYSEAFELEEHFLSHPGFWVSFKEYIGHYMVMLMIKDQREHLQALFKEVQFKYAFLPWWEAYMSLLVDETTRITRMNETVAIINQVHSSKKVYTK